MTSNKTKIQRMRGYVRHMLYAVAALGLMACGGQVAEDSQGSDEPVHLPVAEPGASGVAPSRGDSVHFNGQPPAMREAPPALYVAARDVNLRSALGPAVQFWRDAGERIEFRSRCAYNVKCVEVFHEGMPAPDRWRVACPRDVPLRREMSVDASLAGERLADALVTGVGVALGHGACVETAEWFEP